MDGEGSAGRLRSFALGGLVGASAAVLAAARSRRPRRHRQPGPGGLAAFEGAPCYREILEQEELAAPATAPRAAGRTPPPPSARSRG